MAKKRKKTGIAHAEIVRLFGERLRELRHARGMTQVELARAAQVNVVYLGRLEGGKAAPGLDLLERLAKALGTTVADLLPPPAAPDTLTVLKEQAKTLFDGLLQSEDKDTLQTLCLLLRLLTDRTK